MAGRARSNFQKAGIEKQIEVRVGDALEEMNKMDKGLDFIFMDVDKEDYLPVLTQLLAVQNLERELITQKTQLLIDRIDLYKDELKTIINSFRWEKPAN